MVYQPRKSPVKGRGGKLREVEIRVQFRFKRGVSKGGAESVCRAIGDALESRGITCEDVLIKEAILDLNGNIVDHMWASWENGEVW